MAKINIDIDACIELANRMASLDDFGEIIKLQKDFCTAIRLFGGAKKPSAFLEANSNYQSLCEYALDFAALEVHTLTAERVEDLFSPLQITQSDVWTTLENIVSDDMPTFKSVEDFISEKFANPKSFVVWLAQGYFSSSYIALLENLKSEQ